MKKRIVCVLLTLIMLVGMLPLSAAAAGKSISENAITILKQLEGYHTKCSGKGTTFGYGTICTNAKDHKNYHSEKEADVALREALKELDKAVNSFATKKGLALTQGQHDALVLFSFQNGTAWTTGTGDFQSAIISGKTGTEFLNAICRWNLSDNDERRMIEANMYLNGVYSSVRPANYIWVTYNAYGGSISESTTQYYDVSNKPAPHLVPTNPGYTFTGWLLLDETNNVRNPVTALTADHHGKTLLAGWVNNAESTTPLNPTGLDVHHIIPFGQLTSSFVYTYNTGKKAFEIYTSAKVQNVSYFYMKDTTNLQIDALYRDENGQLWGRLVDNGYVLTYWIAISGTGSSGYAGNVAYIDVTVTVTNSRVNMRENASISSRINGSYSQGDQLRIINTANGSGFLWGQVAAGPMDNTPIGWVALMYTNFDSVRDNPQNSKPVNNSTAIATAVVNYPKGYVNVRSGAGTDNQIVGALAHDTEVSIYEIKYVNGQEWGRCNVGWFCLNYAKVTKLVTDNSYTTDVGFTSYVFTGELQNVQEVYKTPDASADKITLEDVRTMLGDEEAEWSDVNKKITVSNLLNKGGITWGKFALGWVKVTDNTTYAPLNVKLDVAKYLVSADSVTVRSIPDITGVRKDTLVKNVEFNVNETNQVIVVGDTVWGYATKVGEDAATYDGWVNLATKYVIRNGTPTVDVGTGSASTGPVMMAKVINTNSLKVRITGATYGRQIGTLSLGTTAVILEEQNGWYNLDIDVDGDPETGSWVSGAYLDIYQSSTGSTSSGSTSTGTTAAVETGMGVVANTYSGVNVRNGAGTGYAATGKLLPGTAVEILEVVTKGAAKWGRTVQGWICMDYITMVSNYPIAGSTTGTTNSNTTTGNTTTSSEPAIFTGYIKNTAGATVYKTTSEESDPVRKLAYMDPVTMHELLAVTEEVKVTSTTDNEGSKTTTVEKTSYWARVNDGYIPVPAENIGLDPVDEYVYTVTGIDTQNVRTGPGTDSPKAGFKLEKGDQVKVTKLAIVKNGMWGRIECEKGDQDGNVSEYWASMLYMTKGAVTIQTETTPETNTNTNTNTNTVPEMGLGSNVGGYVNNSTGYRYTGKVINTNAVNVRATASTTAAITTQLKYGQSLVVYETTISENMAWGRCDAGWVYLYYVDLTPVVNGAVDARVVYNDNTVIYTDVNGSGVAGTYARMSVIDIYEIVGTMARTDKGWVSTNDLL